LVPIYLNENDGIFNENYYDVVKGMDLGIFASYYEPWGYTPLESISYGVATITSDMAGFGRVVASDYGGNKAGVKVLNRIDRGDEKSVEDLYYYLYRFCKKDKKSLLLEKSAAYIFSKNFSWEVFIKNYLKAYEIAKDRKDKIE
jgi:phosphorylase/glycogen(starch) synthase